MLAICLRVPPSKPSSCDTFVPIKLQLCQPFCPFWRSLFFQEKCCRSWVTLHVLSYSPGTPFEPSPIFSQNRMGVTAPTRYWCTSFSLVQSHSNSFHIAVLFGVIARSKFQLATSSRAASSLILSRHFFRLQSLPVCCGGIHVSKAVVTAGAG